MLNKLSTNEVVRKHRSIITRLRVISDAGMLSSEDKRHIVLINYKDDDIEAVEIVKWELTSAGYAGSDLYLINTFEALTELIGTDKISFVIILHSEVPYNEDCARAPKANCGAAIIDYIDQIIVSKELKMVPTFSYSDNETLEYLSDDLKAEII